MYRKPVVQELVGKTIQGVDTSADNLLTLDFTDGSSVTLEAEYSGIPGLYMICVWDEARTETKET